MRSDREGYTPYLFTIADRLEDGWYTGEVAKLMRVVGTMSVQETVSLLRRPWRMLTDSPNEYRLAKRDSDLHACALMLARLGESGAKLIAGDAPDFTVTLSGGRTVRIEVTEVSDSDDTTNALIDLRIALKDAVQADPAAWPKNEFVSINLGPSSTRPPNSNERTAIIAEVLRLLRSGAHRSAGSQWFFDEAYPTLQSFGSWLYVGPLEGQEKGYVDIMGPAYSFNGGALVGKALTRLKAKKQMQYRGDGPLWLLMSITDQRGIFDESLEAFRTVPLDDIAPFDRVILAYGGQMAIRDRVQAAP